MAWPRAQGLPIDSHKSRRQVGCLFSIFGAQPVSPGSGTCLPIARCRTGLAIPFVSYSNSDGPHDFRVFDAHESRLEPRVLTFGTGRLPLAIEREVPARRRSDRGRLDRSHRSSVRCSSRRLDSFRWLCRVFRHRLPACHRRCGNRLTERSDLLVHHLCSSFWSEEQYHVRPRQGLCLRTVRQR